MFWDFILCDCAEVHKTQTLPFQINMQYLQCAQKLGVANTLSRGPVKNCVNQVFCCYNCIKVLYLHQKEFSIIICLKQY